MTIIDATSYPETITIYGQKLTRTIAGDYPYDCVCRDKYPQAMIYRGNGCWEPCLLRREVKKVGKYDTILHI